MIIEENWSEIIEIPNNIEEEHLFYLLLKEVSEVNIKSCWKDISLNNKSLEIINYAIYKLNQMLHNQETLLISPIATIKETIKAKKIIKLIQQLNKRKLEILQQLNIYNSELIYFKLRDEQIEEDFIKTNKMERGKNYVK